MQDAKLKALDLLNELENVTKESLAQYRQAEPSPQAQPSRKEAPTTPATPSGEYVSAHADYQPALKDRDIVDALLRLQPKLRKPAAQPKPASSVQAVAPQDWGRLHARQQLRNRKT